MRKVLIPLWVAGLVVASAPGLDARVDAWMGGDSIGFVGSCRGGPCALPGGDKPRLYALPGGDKPRPYALAGEGKPRAYVPSSEGESGPYVLSGGDESRLPLFGWDTPRTQAVDSGESRLEWSRAELLDQAHGLSSEVLDLALEAAECALAGGQANKRVLGVIDYSLPSTEQRMWVIDLDSGTLLFSELVAHGKNTGENHARHFSNEHGTRKSSLGLFLAAEPYYGRNGYSLRLDGLEPGFNHRARPRAIVFHGAWYVSDAFAEKHGRLGRSWGCPAVRTEVTREMIETLSEGGLLFIYYPDPDWLQTSSFLNGCRT